MEEITSLKITGYDGELLKNTFFKPEIPQQGLALLFPGQGYTCAMPLLYYPTRLLIASGVAVLWVEYNYTQKDAYPSLSSQERLHWIAHDASAAVQAARSHAPHPRSRSILIGKSLGSFALAHLALNEPDLKTSSFVWLTPLVRNPFVQQAFAEAAPRSLLILGDADPHYDAEQLERARQSSGAQVLLIPRATHSLEVPGDIPATLLAMKMALDAVSAFWEG